MRIMYVLEDGEDQRVLRGSDGKDRVAKVIVEN